MKNSTNVTAENKKTGRAPCFFMPFFRRTALWYTKRESGRENRKGRIHYGGQAVIEGAMMRGPGSVVTCVRTSSGEILTRREAELLPQDRRRWTRFPVLRGMSAIYESLLCGMRALLFSAGASGEDEEPLTGKKAALFLVLPAAGLGIPWSGARGDLLSGKGAASYNSQCEGAVPAASAVRYKFSHDGHAARTVCLFFFRRAAFLRARAAPARIAPCHCRAGL